MPYKQPKDRDQMMFCSMGSFVEEDSVARVIDVFVDSLDMKDLGFRYPEAPYEGNPPYDPRCLLKLYLYGGQKKIRSSRMLAETARLNVEARWLLGGLEPDFRTVSDFRKNNAKNLRKVFREFNRKLADYLEKGFLSIDGSKFAANNSKDNNFTAAKLDDRITWLNQHMEDYLRQIEVMDEQEEEEEKRNGFTKEALEQKLKEAKERVARYEGYRSYMEENGLSQMSLTDPDSKLMKNKNGFGVSYNIQTAVDSETHMIEDYQVTTQPTDHGQLEPTIHEIKKEDPEKVLEVVADKGYQKEEDMAACLEAGIIPHVILPEGKGGYELELSYEEAEITEEEKKSSRAEDLKRCLHAGVVPEAYQDVIDGIEVREKRVLVREEDEEENPGSIYGTTEEMKERAKEGYFVRDPEQNVVYCPMGEMLRQKSIKNNGSIRYANKAACRRCQYRNQCYSGKNEWKEIDFNKDSLEKPNRKWIKEEEAKKAALGNEEEGTGDQETGMEAPGPGQEEIEKGEPEGKEQEPGKKEKKKKRGHYEKKKVVRILLKPNREKMDKRKCTSEHPFGTIKRAMDAGYYLLRGKHKVDGESALFCLGYNLKRAISLFGTERLKEILA